MKEVGYIVTGVSPATLLAAQARFAAREAERNEATSAGKPPQRKLTDPAQRKLPRTKLFGPTHIKAAAEDALALARKAGCTRLEISERKD